MIPYYRDFQFVYGQADQVSPLIRRVIAGNAGPFTFTGTGTYIVGHGQVAVIDPGPDDPAHLDAILAAVEGETVSHILITHHHIDHSPLAKALQAATGAPIHGCALSHPPSVDLSDIEPAAAVEADHDDAFEPDVSLCAGGTVEGPGWSLEAIATPGHTSNHLCFALAQENALFSGDHIMGWSTTVIVPPDGDMSDYLESLETIRARGFATLWPTHGPPVTDPGPFIDAYAAHRRERLAQIVEALGAGPASISDLVPRLYAEVDPRLWPAAARSMQAAMIYLSREGVLEGDGRTYRLTGA